MNEEDNKENNCNIVCNNNIQSKENYSQPECEPLLVHERRKVFTVIPVKESINHKHVANISNESASSAHSSCSQTSVAIVHRIQPLSSNNNECIRTISVCPTIYQTQPLIFSDINSRVCTHDAGHNKTLQNNCKGIDTCSQAAVQSVQALPNRPLSTVINNFQNLHCTCEDDKTSSATASSPHLFQPDNLYKNKHSKEITNSLINLLPFRNNLDTSIYKRLTGPSYCPVHCEDNHSSYNVSLNVPSVKNQCLTKQTNATTIPIGCPSEKVSKDNISNLGAKIPPELIQVNCPFIKSQICNSPHSSTPLLGTQFPKIVPLSSLNHCSLQPSASSGVLELASPFCHHTCSLNQLTINSTRSIDIGITDGRNLKIIDTITDPSQLSRLQYSKNESENRSSDEEQESYFSEETSGRRERILWKNKVEYILSCLGSCVGLTNLWHFPYLCNKYGGVFLVPYTIMLLLCGAPLLLLELAIGQYTRAGPVTALYNICPLFTGVGVSISLLAVLSSWHQVVSIAWSLVYFIRSFSPSSWAAIGLPLDNLCDLEEEELSASYSLCVNSTMNVTSSSRNEDQDNLVLMTSTSMSWRRSGVQLLQSIQWEVMGAMVIVWFLLYFSLWRSIRSSAKVVYITATVPYIIMMICLWRALTLPGASVGLQTFFTADWRHLLHYPMWVSAASHTLHNSRISTGIMMVLSSYKKFNTNVVSDAWIISLTSGFTSIVASVIVFSGFGNIAMRKDINIYHLRAQGPELVFLMLPSTWSEVADGSFVWAAVFFILVLFTAFDTLMASLEVVITSLKDCFGERIRDHIKYEWLFVLIVCVIIAMTGLPCILQGGQMYFWLRDQNSFGLWAAYLGLLQLIAILVFYKVDKLTQNIREMTGKQLTYYFRICWWIFAPLVYINIWVYSMVNYYALTATPNNNVFQPLIANTSSSATTLPPSAHDADEQVYPTIVVVFGWLLFAIMTAPIPICAIIFLHKSKEKSILGKLRQATTSRIRKCENCAKTVFGSAKEHNCQRDFNLSSMKVYFHLKTKEQPSDVTICNTHTALLFQSQNGQSSVQHAKARKAIPSFNNSNSSND